MSAAFIGFGMNVADGLWGLNIQQTQWPFINEFTYEFLNTTSQSGPIHDKDGLVFAGDSYYTNSAYPQGWTYFSNIIGNPYLQTNKQPRARSFCRNRWKHSRVSVSSHSISCRQLWNL